MDETTKKQTTGAVTAQQKRRRWASVFLCLAVVATLGTLAVLKLTGVAMTQKEKVLDCHFVGEAAHTHNDDCYDADGVLVCPLAERPLHTHDDSCYTTETYLVCGREESAGHQHSDSCYTLVRGGLTCGQEEGEEHTHTDDCYGWYSELTCGMSEGEGAHWHSDACYETATVLTCGLEELTEEHVHGPECFVTLDAAEAEFLRDAQPDADEESAGDPNADVESAADWDAMISWLDLTGDWNEDLVTVAQSQLGYAESTANFIVDESGEHKGYTRYGAWYGVPYGDWCAMFASFCMEYAGIPEDAIPYEAGVESWIDKLTNEDMYAEADSDYVPKTGDLLFLDLNDIEGADHVGIIEKITANEITTIEGNSGNAVREVTYAFDSDKLAGFGILPEEPEDAASAARPYDYMPAQMFEAWAGDVLVSVYAPEGAFPVDTVMNVRLLDDDDDVIGTIETAAESEIDTVKAVDITFTYQGEEIEPAIPINVTMSSDFVADAESPRIVHVTDDGVVGVVDDAVRSAANEITFDSDAFSVYAVVVDLVDGGYPMQQFTAWAGDVQVNVTAEAGAFPANSQMVVETVDLDEVYDAVTAAVGNAAEALRAVDISFYDADWNEIEPAKPISVTMTSSAVAEAEVPVIVHLDNDGNADMIETEDVIGSDISFESDSFSIYIIAEGETVKTPRVTYHFMQAKEEEGNVTYVDYTFLNTAGERVSFQIVKNGEKLTNVGQPEYEVKLTGGKKFAGWYPFDPATGAITSNVSISFDAPITVTADADVYVRPAYGDVAYIKFYEYTWTLADAGQINNIYNMVQVLLDDETHTATYDTAQQSVTAPKANLAFTGWSTEGYTPTVTDETSIQRRADGGYDYTDTANVSYATDTRAALADTTVTVTSGDPYEFYPIFKTVHWLHFNANVTQQYTNDDGETATRTLTGQSYSAPAAVAIGAKASTVEPADPTWTGYKFDYWSLTQPIYDENGQLTNRPEEFNWDQTLDSGAYQTDDVTLYAVWENWDAKYTVVFWQQLVTDDKGWPDAQKNFEYGGQVTMDGKTNDTITVNDALVQRALAAFIAEDNTNTTKFTGFEINHVRSDASKKVSGDSTTVVNVYMNRQLITMKFYKNGNSTNAPGYDNNAYNVSESGYVKTSATSGTQYALVDGKYIPLTRVDTYGYTITTGDNGTQYGVDADGNYVPLVRSSRQEYTYDTTNSNSGTQYGLVDGEYVQLTNSNYRYTATTSTNNNTTYYGLVNGSFVKLNRYSGNYYYYSYGFSIYTGTRYTRANSNSRIWYNSTDGTQYTGTRYTRNSTTVYTYTMNGADYTGTRYTRNSTPTYSWTYTDDDGNTVTYTGDRYTEASSSTTVTVLTGLYGQNITKYDDGWPDGGWSYYNASNGSKGLVYLGQFVLNGLDTRDTTKQEIRLYYTGTTSKNYEYYLEDVDGGVTLNGTGHGSGNLNLVEKFEGYHITGYRYSSSSNWTTTSAGGTVSMSGYTTVQLRYSLLSYNLRYLDSYDNQPLTGFDTASVKYTESLNGYEPSATPTTTRPGQVWDGKWYKDQACKVEFDWENTTMPTHDMAVYAGWKDERYRVEIEPDGGVLSETESTYFWSKYGGTVQEYRDVTRYYVEADDGAYYYYENLWDRSWPDSADGDPASQRKAGYISIAAYEELLAKSAAGGELTDLEKKLVQDGVVDTSKRYKYDDGIYSLVGWYYVDANGHITTPYNFGAQITGKVRIRAVWRVVGEYKVGYSAQVVDPDGNPLNTEGKVMANEKDDTPMLAFDFSQDGNSYADKSETVVLKQPGVLNVDGDYVFLGWYYDGQLYQPGNIYQIRAEIADESKIVWLYPAYVPASQAPVKTIDVIFDANGGTTTLKDGTGVRDTSGILSVFSDASNHEIKRYVTENETLVTLSPVQLNESLGVIYGADEFVRTGYTLIGWNTDQRAADNGEVKFELGVTIGADDLTEAGDATNDTENTLYAVWEPVPYTVTVKKIVVGSNADKTDFSYMFTPSFTHADGSTIADNVDMQNTFGLTDGGEKVFEKVVISGDKVAIREDDYANFITTATYTVTDSEGNTSEPAEYVNGDALTITGDTVITYTNTRRSQPVSIMKTSDDRKPLAGAEFTIDYDVNDDGVIDENDKLVSDAEGWLLGSNEAPFTLNSGTYTLTETKAPTGYMQLTKDITLTVTSTGVEVSGGFEYKKITEANGEPLETPYWQITVTNSTGQVLPHTGGMGAETLTVIGLVMFAGSALMLGFATVQRKRRAAADR